MDNVRMCLVVSVSVSVSVFVSVYAAAPAFQQLSFQLFICDEAINVL